ncbi:MAG: hypothetical protein HY716_03865 [Planctomycetes bacterium]|nr:hypothetical protein [Planctomycetota bacterium]
MRRLAVSLALALLAASPAAAQSGAARRAAREALEALESRFARELAHEGMGRFEISLARAVERWGDDALKAARRVGPRIALAEMERHGAPAARILARWGDDGARLLAVEGEGALRVYGALGEEGIDLLLRRRGTVEAALLPRLAEPIASSGRSAEILAVIEKHGDRACQFMWRNKGVIFGAAVLAAFLSDPRPYLDGVKELVVAPARDVALEAARRTDWNAVVFAALAIVAALGALRLWSRRREAQSGAAS